MLYHRKQPDMRGDTLLTLKMLKSAHPDLYERHMKKYDDRPELPKRTIISLGSCRWTDLIFLTPIFPHNLKHAFEEAGLAWDPSVEYYEIDPRDLDISFTMFMFPRKANRKHDKYEIFRQEDLSKYREVPAGTKEYYRAHAAEGKQPLIFHDTTHVLYRGTINISRCDVVRP